MNTCNRISVKAGLGHRVTHRDHEPCSETWTVGKAWTKVAMSRSDGLKKMCPLRAGIKASRAIDARHCSVVEFWKAANGDVFQSNQLLFDGTALSP